MKAFFTASAVCLMATMGVAKAASLPSGVYIFSFLDINSHSCFNGFSTGFLVYPGPGKNGTELDFTGGPLGTSPYVVSGFPQSPPSGLAGWGPTSPASMQLVEFAEQVPAGEFPGTISFVLKQGTPHLWFITVNINVGDSTCSQSETLQSFRSGPAS